MAFVLGVEHGIQVVRDAIGWTTWQPWAIWLIPFQFSSDRETATPVQAEALPNWRTAQQN
jgi:hypothetical protein